MAKIDFTQMDNQLLMELEHISAGYVKYFPMNIHYIHQHSFYGKMSPSSSYEMSLVTLHMYKCNISL